MPDNMGPVGAKLLARRIEDYWVTHGYRKPEVWVEMARAQCRESRPEENIYVVRSNMVNGRPIT